MRLAHQLERGRNVTHTCACCEDIFSNRTGTKHEQVSIAQAEKLVAKGATLLDVRPTYQFERERVAGAVNVPMFRKVAGSGPWDNAKKLVMRFGLAMEATGAGQWPLALPSGYP